MIGSKNELGMRLSRLKGFEKAKVRVEQYSTEADIAAEVLWTAHMKGEVRDKKVVDLGCGTGVFGIGALLLSAREVFFVDIDKGVLRIAKKNIERVESEGLFKGKWHIVEKDVEELDELDGKKADLVLQNPPFGVKKTHADRAFLKKAFEIADIIYSFHKIESMVFLETFSRDERFKITNKFLFDFPLKYSMEFHEKKVKKIRVICVRFERF